MPAAGEEASSACCCLNIPRSTSSTPSTSLDSHPPYPSSTPSTSLIAARMLACRRPAAVRTSELTLQRLEPEGSELGFSVTFARNGHVRVGGGWDAALLDHSLRHLRVQVKLGAGVRKPHGSGPTDPSACLHTAAHALGHDWANTPAGAGAGHRAGAGLLRARAQPAAREPGRVFGGGRVAAGRAAAHGAQVQELHQEGPARGLGLGRAARERGRGYTFACGC